MAANNLQILITAKADQALATLRQTSEALIEMVTSSKAFQESVGFADEQLKSFNAVLTETTIKTIGYSKLPKFVDAYDGVLSAVNAIAELNNKIDSVKKGLEEFGGIAIPTFETVKKEAFDVFKEFDSARAKVGTLTTEAGALAQQMQGLARETKNQYSSTVLLNASYDVLSAGFSKTADVSAIMANSVKLAKAGFTELGIASDAVTTILNAYGKDASEAANVANELIQTQNLGKLTVDEYGRSIGQVATIAAQAGVGLTELNAIIAVSTTKGLGASETITGLRQAIASILSPSSQAVEQAKALGIQFDAAALKSKGLAGVLKEIAEKGGATPDVLNKLFGSVEAVSAILPATANNMADFQKAIVSLKTETGALDKAFDSVTGSIDNQLEQFRNRFRETLVGIGEGVAGWVRYLLAEGQKALGFFELLDPRQQLAAFQGIDGAVSGVINTVKELISTVVALAAGLAGVFVAEKLISAYDASFKVLNLTLDLTSARTAVLTGLQTAQAIASQVLGTVVGFLTGTTTAYSLSLDLAAIKAGVLAAAQSALGVAMTFLNAVAVAQLKIMILTPVWALDAATGLFTLTASFLKGALAIPIFSGSMSVASIATKVFTAASTFLTTQVLPILIGGFKATIAQVLLLGPALVQIAGTVALFYGAFEAGKSIIDTFLATVGQLTGLRVDDFSKNLAASVGATGIAVASTRKEIQLFGVTLLDVTEASALWEQAIAELSAGLDRAKNPIDAIATGISNYINLILGAANGSDRFGSSFGLITKAQLQAQEQQIQFTAAFDKYSESLTRGNDILNRYGLQTLEVGESAKLGADGLAAFRKEAESQIGSLSAQIESLKKVKSADAALQQQIDNTIRLLESQKSILQGRLVFLEEDAKKTGQAANAQKNASKTLEELSEAYKKNTDAIAKNTTEATVLIKEQQAKGTLNAKESQAEILGVERKGFQDRIKLAESQLPLLRAKLVGETDKVKIKAVQDEILAVEKAGFDARKSLADLQIKERQDQEQKAVKAVEDANAKADAAVKISITNQIAAIKQLGLSREVEAKRITDIEKNAAIARVQAIKDEIAQVQALQSSGALSPEEGQKRLITLQGQLADANLARIEKIRAAENALRAEIIAGIEEQGRKAKLVDDRRVASANSVLASLKREQDLFTAKSGLETAQGDLAKTRLENQLKITEAIGNESAAQQLKLQIQQQEIINQERSFAAQLKNLEITQQIKAAELDRQKILDQIAIKQEQQNLLKLQQKEGVQQSELDLQKEVISLAENKAKLTDQAIADQATFNQYAKQELLTKQQATRETTQTNIAAEALKGTLSGLNINTGNVSQSFAAVNTGIVAATTSATALNTQLKTTPEVVKLTDGSIVSVNQKLGESVKTIDDLNKKFGSTSEVVKLADGSIVSINEELSKVVGEADNLDAVFNGTVKNTDKIGASLQKIGTEVLNGFSKTLTVADLLNQAIAGMTENTKALVQQALAVKAAFAAGATAFQGSATGLGGLVQTAAKGADGLIGSAPGQTVAQNEAIAASQGLTNEFEKAAFIFKARAKELEGAGLSSSEKINIGGAQFDYKEAAQLFGEAASNSLNGQVAEFAKSVLGQRIAVAQTGQNVLGNSLEEILRNTEELKRQKLVGFAGGTSRPIKSGVAMVGEAGPELINVTPQGTHVLSNPDTKKLLGSVKGYASGTGSLPDFLGAAKVKAEDALNEILNRAYGKGSGLTFQSLNNISAVNDVARSIRDSLGDIADAIASGDIRTAEALAVRAQRLNVPLSDFGIYRGIAEQARGILGSFLNGGAIPKFERGTGATSNSYHISISDRPNPGADLTNALLSLSGR